MIGNELKVGDLIIDLGYKKEYGIVLEIAGGVVVVKWFGDNYCGESRQAHHGNCIDTHNLREFNSEREYKVIR